MKSRDIALSTKMNEDDKKKSFHFLRKRVKFNSKLFSSLSLSRSEKMSKNKSQNECKKVWVESGNALTKPPIDLHPSLAVGKQRQFHIAYSLFLCVRTLHKKLVKRKREGKDHWTSFWALNERKRRVENEKLEVISSEAVTT